MKKYITIVVRLLLTIGVLAIGAYLANTLEYLSQLSAIDNLIGALPVMLFLTITGLLIALLWKRHQNAEVSTRVLAWLAVIFAILFIPSITGNWYPLARIADTPTNSPDMTVYTPFTADTKVAKLPQKASISIANDMPSLDGATALYPLYAAFINAAYDVENYDPSTLVCTNTPNAYNAIIAGERDIIFVAGPSQKQKQAAKDAGIELVFTPIGREAFVFMVDQSNPIDGLTHQQLKNIYSGKTAKWNTLGWENGKNIIAFQRPEGSGSQTGLQKMMGSLPIQKPQPLPDNSLAGSGSMMQQISVEWQGVRPALGYTYRYYAVSMYPNPDAKLLAIDGVYPSSQTITDESYPFTSNFYAVTNGQPEGNVKKLIDWILSDEGQDLIEGTGYSPIK